MPKTIEHASSTALAYYWKPPEPSAFLTSPRHRMCPSQRRTETSQRHKMPSIHTSTISSKSLRRHSTNRTNQQIRTPTTLGFRSGRFARHGALLSTAEATHSFMFARRRGSLLECEPVTQSSAESTRPYARHSCSHSTQTTPNTQTLTTACFSGTSYSTRANSSTLRPIGPSPWPPPEPS